MERHTWTSPGLQDLPLVLSLDILPYLQVFVKLLFVCWEALLATQVSGMFSAGVSHSPSYLEGRVRDMETFYVCSDQACHSCHLDLPFLPLLAV